MRRLETKSRIGALFVGALHFSAFLAGAQISPGEYPVVLDDRTLFTIKAPRPPYSAQQRAQNISADLRAAAQDRQTDASVMRIVPGETDSVILAGHTFILAVTDADARLENLSREALVRQRQQVIAQAITEYRRVRAPWIILRNVALMILCWMVVAVLLSASGRLKRRIAVSLQRRLERFLEGRNLGGVHSLFGKQLHAAMGAALRIARALVAIFFISIALSYSLGLFPETAALSQRLLDSLSRAAAHVAMAFVGYLPNLAVILLVIALTYCFVKVIRALFGAIGNSVVSVPGFHEEWVEPTRKLLTLIAVMFALVIIFPYLPGGDSPALRGASIFLGVLVSLGSSTAMGNVVAGIILTYMRPFRVGDRVKISDTVGDVIDRSLLVTRLRTVKNVSTIIPNSMILGAHILNYSAEAKISGLIVHTSVTIGYDAPWRAIHVLLTEAALATQGVLPEPRPFVLQTSLNDSHITYEINAFTDLPNEMHHIASRLHQNIQDEFNRAGFEIMSPSYLSMRDGNGVTIPEAERPSGYSAPSFRVHLAPNGEIGRAASTAPAQESCDDAKKHN